MNNLIFAILFYQSIRILHEWLQDRENYFHSNIGFSFVLLFYDKKTIPLVLDGRYINVQLVNLFSSETKVSTEDDKQYIRVLHTLFDYPLLFIPSKDNSSIFVLYFFDIEIHVFSINISISSTDRNNSNFNNSLNKIILSRHNFQIKSLTNAEINEMIDKITMMSESKYRRFSVPSLDLGVYKIYFSKKRIIEILRQGIHQLDDMNFTGVHSKLNSPW